MVTTQKLEQLRVLNCGIRTLRAPLDPDVLVREIADYDPLDAAEVSRRIRATAGRDATVDELLVFYRDVLKEYANGGAPDLTAEGAAAAAYFRWLSPTIKDRARIMQERNQLEMKNTELLAVLTAAQEKAAEKERIAGMTRQALML